MRRDLLLRHDRTVHAKDNLGEPLQPESRKKNQNKQTSSTTAANAATAPSKPAISIDQGTLEQIEASSDGMLDLETAAMLMTDFQHKAAAAAANAPLQNGEGSLPDFSPDRSSILETSDFLSGGSSLPQLPWDSLMSTNPPQQKAHSLASDVSSQDNLSQNASFVHMGSIQPNQSSLPSIMERQNSLGNSASQAFPTLADSFPVSGSPTPNGLSPFPSMTGPVSPVNYRRSPGPSQALTLPRAPQMSTETERESIANYIGSEFPLPNLAYINLYLSTYFNLFHHHLPFLHPITFRPGQTEPALLLAVISIGALYNFDDEQAYRMHHGSKKLVNQFLQNKENFDSRKCPLWTMQSTLLNMLFESWSGGATGLEWACSIKSLLANVSGTPDFAARATNLNATDGCWQQVRTQTTNRSSRAGTPDSRSMDQRRRLKENIFRRLHVLRDAHNDLQPHACHQFQRV